MRNRRKGWISLAVMIILTLVLIYTSEDIYEGLSGSGSACVPASTSSGEAESEKEASETEAPEIAALPGTYEAASGAVTVRVTISQDARIMAVTLVDFEGGEEEQKAAAEMTGRIVEAQSVSAFENEEKEKISENVMDAVAQILAGNGTMVE